MEMKKFTLFNAFIVASFTFFNIHCQRASFIEIGIAPGVKKFNLDRNLGLLTKGNHSRSVRTPSTCQVPIEDERNYELKCKLYPSTIECMQKCMFGYTFSEGTSRSMKCIYTEDKWKPKAEFDQCQPFIDCGLTLGQGGYSKCSTFFMDEGPKCDVSCAHFEDKPEVPLRTYTCDIKGKWTPNLPFCVRAGSGLKLIHRPKGI